MSELLDFLEFAGRSEFTTPGGVINFAIVGVLGLLAAAIAGSELLKFLAWFMDRSMHLFEKLLEFLAGAFSIPYEAEPKPYPYEPESLKRATGLLVVIGIFSVACMLALGGARYKPINGPAKDDTPEQPHPSGSLPPSSSALASLVRR
jgi:hypothetical protein